MSHTSSISAIKIASIGALQAAIAELNTKGISCSLVAGETPRAFFPDQVGMGKADYVVKLTSAPYDIGLYKQEDGTYEARTDFWGGHIEKCLGARPTTTERIEQAKMGKLFQTYGIHAAMEQARRKGHTCRRIDQADGTVQLEITGV